MGDKPTIRTVADTAGVAVGTVSRVLNGHKSVSLDVRRRVTEAIEALEYEPNRVAQSMRLGVTRTVACVVRDISLPGFGFVVNAAEEMLRNDGYTLLLSITNEQKDRELQLLRILSQSRVDALIMATSSEQDVELCDQIERVGVPVVLLDRDASRQFDSITIDHRSGTRAATELLIGLGHTRIALLTGRSSLRPGRERIAGFEDAYGRLPDGERNGIVRAGGFSADFGFSETSALLSASPRPTALIAGGMGMLSGMLRAIRIHGLKVPDDISVIAGADSELTGLTDPEITAVRWSGADEGRLAVQLLLNRLRGFTEPAPQNVLLSTELVIRGSCAPVDKSQ